jgi:hypothetical protein
MVEVRKRRGAVFKVERGALTVPEHSNHVVGVDFGMNRGDRLQSDRGHGLHIDWGVCPGKMSYQWNRNNDLLIWRKAVGLR